MKFTGGSRGTPAIFFSRASQQLKDQHMTTPLTPAKINGQQGYGQPHTKAEALRSTVPAKPTAPPTPATKTTTLPALPDTRTTVQTYLDEVAPASIVGRMIKFTKEGAFVTADDAEQISDEIEFAALCDQTLIGWIRFNGQGEPPERHMGLLYDNFVMPARGTLGHDDPSSWEIGLSGQPQDPWQHHVYLVLQNVGTQELFTFVTSSQTGRRAIGNLLRATIACTKPMPASIRSCG